LLWINHLEMFLAFLAIANWKFSCPPNYLARKQTWSRSLLQLKLYSIRPSPICHNVLNFLNSFDFFQLKLFCILFSFRNFSNFAQTACQYMLLFKTCTKNKINITSFVVVAIGK
jgi:hypothetical protein